MEKLINTSEILKMEIVISKDFIINKNLDWTDIAFMYEQGWLTNQTVQDLAENMLDRENEDAVIGLLNCDTQDSQLIKEKLSNLVKDQSSQTNEKILKNFKLLLDWLFESNPPSIIELFQTIEGEMIKLQVSVGL